MRGFVLAVGIWLGTELLSGCEKGVSAWRRRRRRKDRGSKVEEQGRKIAVVSSAAIPWMTGTAVNPTLRAAYLAHVTDNEVTLVVPWVAPCQQRLIFPDNLCFSSPAEQEACMREWIRKRTGLEPPLNIVWYAGRYDKLLLGIFPVGNPMHSVARTTTDVVVLEEPEHIAWFHHGPQWTSSFGHVVGVMHTNQVSLGWRNAGIFGPLMAAAAWALTYMLCGMHCHKVIKLSDTLQTLPRQATCFVHGAAPRFLEEGARKAAAAGGAGPTFSKGAYALGKVVFGKGWEELLELLERWQAGGGGVPPPIDCFGDGEARGKIERRAVKRGLPLAFHGKCDHLDGKLQDYKVFVNASTSDVVATTSIEALAMGKWLVCAAHPCNAFAARFPNTLAYSSSEDFARHLRHALRHDPQPLDAATLQELGWEAATRRFLRAAEIPAHGWPSLPAEVVASALWRVYRTVIGVEAFRILTCAGAGTRETPLRVTDYDPEGRAAGGAGNSLWRTFGRLAPRSVHCAGAGWVTGSAAPQELALAWQRERLYRD